MIKCCDSSRATISRLPVKRPVAAPSIARNAIGSEIEDAVSQNICPGKTAYSGQKRLSSQSQRFDDGAIPLHILVFNIIQQPAAFSNQHQKTSSGEMILAVHLEMVGQIGYSMRQKPNLDFRRTGI
jgi:hypothetical protein